MSPQVEETKQQIVPECPAEPERHAAMDALGQRDGLKITFKGEIRCRMFFFCPFCNNFLKLFSGIKGIYYACETCSFEEQVDNQYVFRTHPKMKELSHILGGPKAWENAQITEEKCPKCEGGQAYFMQIQIRKTKAQIHIVSCFKFFKFLAITLHVYAGKQALFLKNRKMVLNFIYNRILITLVLLFFIV
ncbi:DNA-directed RNA polymerase III subunit [Trichinella pseudospiralis]